MSVRLRVPLNEWVTHEVSYATIKVGAHLWSLDPRLDVFELHRVEVVRQMGTIQGVTFDGRRRDVGVHDPSAQCCYVAATPEEVLAFAVAEAAHQAKRSP